MIPCCLCYIPCMNGVNSLAVELSVAILFEGASAEFSLPSSPTVPPYHHCSKKLKNLMMTFQITQLTRDMTIGLLVANRRMSSKRNNLRVPKRCKFDASAPRIR